MTVQAMHCINEQVIHGRNPAVSNAPRLERCDIAAVLARKGDAQTVRVTETTPATQSIAHHAGYSMPDESVGTKHREVSHRPIAVAVNGTRPAISLERVCIARSRLRPTRLVW